jgi:DNA-binding FadR family transcriptional regulator
VITTAAASGLAQVLGLQAAAQAFDFDDVVETRLVLETAVAADLARERRAPETGSELLDAMDDETLTPDEFLALDARFHGLLAEETGNAVYAAIMTGLRAARDRRLGSRARTAPARAPRRARRDLRRACRRGTHADPRPHQRLLRADARIRKVPTWSSASFRNPPR